jgi:hypothetical protein
MMFLLFTTSSDGMHNALYMNTSEVQIYPSTSVEMKNPWHESSGKWCRWSYFSKKNSSDQPYNKFAKKIFEYKHKIEDLQLRKLETDCHNKIISWALTCELPTTPLIPRADCAARLVPAPRANSKTPVYSRWLASSELKIYSWRNSKRGPLPDSVTWSYQAFRCIC